jgi:hypothetical protein
VPKKIKEVKDFIQDDFNELCTKFSDLKAYTKDTIFDLNTKCDGFALKVDTIKKRFNALLSDFDTRLKQS